MLAERQMHDHKPAGPLLTLVPVPRKRLVAALSPIGRRPEIQHHATRLVIDDFGDAVAYEFRCSSCMRWHSWKRGWCLDCTNACGRRLRAADPEHARLIAREARLARFTLYPDAREQEAARKRRVALAARERDPEGARARSREGARLHRERVQSDPIRHKAKVENMRIDNVLRRIDAGIRQGGRKVNGTGTLWARQYVSSAPLALALLSSGRRLADVAADAGVSERLFLSWRTGERRNATWTAADAVLVAIDRFWWEVFDPESSPGLFSGSRARDVVAWTKAGFDAVELWGDDA